MGTASATTWIVEEGDSIQAAINAADPCGTIEVHSGTYNENVNVNKQLILMGIDTGGSGNAITLSSDGITLEGFNATNSGSWNNGGIKVTFSNNNTIKGNTASNNYNGIHLWSSQNNKIYLNNFIDNTENVASSSSTNYWKLTEPITYQYNDIEYTNYLGNYWDDYTGSDADGDGIGDTSYVIPNDNNDNYPLMEPWGITLHQQILTPKPQLIHTQA